MHLQILKLKKDLPEAEDPDNRPRLVKGYVGRQLVGTTRAEGRLCPLIPVIYSECE